MTTLTDLQLCGQISVLAVVFADILTRPKMILAWYGDILERMPAPLAYPLGYCAKCTAGQISAWLFTVYLWRELLHDPLFCALRIISAVSITILAAAILSAVYARLTR